MSKSEVAYWTFLAGVGLVASHVLVYQVGKTKGTDELIQKLKPATDRIRSLIAIENATSGGEKLSQDSEDYRRLEGF